MTCRVISRHRRKIVAPCWSLVLLFIASPAWVPSLPAQGPAQRPARPDGNEIQYSAAPAKGAPSYGLAVEFAFPPHYLSNFSEFRVRVGTSNGKPSPTERTLLFELKSRETAWWRRGDSKTTITRFTLTLPQGQSEVTERHTLLMPQGRFSGYSVTIHEHGRELDRLRPMPLAKNQLNNSSYASRPEETNIVVIDRDAPGPTTITARNRPPVFSTRSETYTPGDGKLPNLQLLYEVIAVEFNQRHKSLPLVPAKSWDLKTALSWYARVSQDGTFSLRLLHPQVLPHQWRWYAPVSLVVVSREDFDWLVDQRPTRFQALRTWVRMGGNLAVTGATDDASRERLATRLGCRGAADRWRPARLHPDRVEFADDWASYGSRRGYDQRAKRLKIPSDTTGISADSVLARSVAWGWVYAIDEPSANRSAWNWRMLLEPDHIGPLPIRYSAGGQFSESSPEYWLGTIPGVGAKPVGWFVGLITLFIAAIGPLNYFWLSRRRLQPAIIVTVPLIALFATALFLGMTVLRDGLTTRGRIRSVTILDHAQRESLTWSRQSYYAAFAPRRFAVPAGSYCAPVLPPRSGDPDLQFTLERLGQTEYFGGDFIHPRTLSQIVVGCAATTSRRLAVLEPPEGEVIVKNQLGCPIDRLVLRDKSGGWHLAEQLKVGERATLRAVSPDESAKNLRQYWLRFRLTSQGEAEFYSSRLREFFFRSSRYSGWSRSQERIAPLLIEQSIERIIKRGELEPGEYVAIVSSSPFVQLAAPIDVDVADLELIVGQW